MNETINYNLKKPAYTDMADVGISNSNLDILDALLFNLNKDKVDTIVGKGLSEKDFTSLLKDKLDGIEEGANNYKHPASHDISIITETSTKKIMTESERIKLRDIEEGATNYQHPTTHDPSIIKQDTNSRFATDAEKSKWNKVIDKVDKVAGKGLTKNEYTDLEKQKVEDNKVNIDNHLSEYAIFKHNTNNRLDNMKNNDARARLEILDIKLQLDKANIVEYLNKTGIGFYDLFENTNYINETLTTATIDTIEHKVKFAQNQTLKMKEQLFNVFSDIELNVYDNNREKLEVTKNTTSASLEVRIKPDSISSGDKLYYNGNVYTISSLVEVA